MANTRLRSRYLPLLLLLCGSSLLPTSLGARNRALEIVRGGTWLYHANEPSPCGNDPLRSSCVFVASSERRLAANPSVELRVTEKINHLDPMKVTVMTKTKGKSDWVGAYCVDNEASPPADVEYIDYLWANQSTTSGVLSFGPLVNMRCSWQFRYFTYEGTNAYVKLATSKFIHFQRGREQPLHVHVATTGVAGEMRVSWVSTNVTGFTVSYDEKLDTFKYQKTNPIATTYAANDMCQAPATNVQAQWFRDPGVMYSVVLNNLRPEARYFYEICTPNRQSCSDVLTFRTPPAPGAQSGAASFFVYGDLGDWNIHATGKLPDKRSATTIELMRRDMTKSGLNYVAVMHVGDLSYAKGRTYLWDQFGALIEPVASEIPYMVGIGNHEYCYTKGGKKDPSGAGATNGFHPPAGNYGLDSDGECGVPTHRRFIMPANGNSVFWWSTEMGLVHHTMISSEHDYTPGSTMYKWIENDLRSVNRKRTPWLFLHLHRPMYTSEKYESDYKVSLLIRKNLEPLLAKYHVDAVFSGHYHAYELTCPVYQEKCRSQKLPDGHQKALAPVHIMVGSAGADVDNAGYYDVPWRVDAKLEYGYGRMHVYNASHAQFEFVRNANGEVGSSTWIISDHTWSV